MLYSLLKPLLFKLDPEQAHQVLFGWLKRIERTPLALLLRQSVPIKPVSCMGLRFDNRLGLAAGLDKNGEYLDVLAALGFGFIEVGTVTPRPQVGNDQPRLFRVTEAEALINRMGFNNQGVDALIENIQRSRFKGILGINIGKNKDTPLEQGKDDYLFAMRKVYPYADYITVNISSPNTPGLRDLQYGDALDDLLSAIKQQQAGLAEQQGKWVPIAVKIAPDLTESELVCIADSLVRHNIDAVIATNTTLNKQSIHGLKHAEQTGGLSGRPLQAVSTEIIRRLAGELKGKIPIIGVGGIDSIVAAREKIEAGATLIQVYSGLIFQGPTLVKNIVRYI